MRHWNDGLSDALKPRCTSPDDERGSGASPNNRQAAGKQNAATLKSCILNHLQNRAEKFTLKIDSRYLSRLERILEDAVKQDDEIRFIVEQYGFTATQYGPRSVVTFEIFYWESEKQTAYVDKRIQEILAELLHPGMNDYEKEKAIHDYIVQHVAYDTSYSRYSAYAALAKGKAVCQGYALLTYRMLKSAGIENRIISGSARGERHAWNMVKIDGRWYHLDTTWNDPVPDIPGRVKYKYYNLSDDELITDHTWPFDTLEATGSFTKALRSKIKSDPDKADFYNSLLQTIRKSRSPSSFR